MERRRKNTVTTDHQNFSRLSIANFAVIPVVTALLAIGGFYYLTKDTLQRHDEEIKAANNAREGIRNEFILNSTKTAEGIAKLDTRAAVQEVQTKIMADTLLKISDQLAKAVR